MEALRTAAGERLLAELAARPEADLLATITALRTRYDAGLVAAAVTQVRLRARARAKFGADADRMFFTADGVEQATRADVAARHAARFAAAGATRVLDLCCGIGGDLLAVARAGLDVTGVDRDPAAVEAARANLAVLGLAGTVRVAEASVEPGWPAAWADPSRRRGGRRVFDPRAYSPPLSFVEELAAAVPLTGAKVAPGIPHDAVPDGAEAEWVSVGGEVKEAALWFGPLATATRRATVLPAGATLVDSGLGAPPVGPPGEWLYEPDGAVIRAGLVGEVVAALPGGRLVDPTIAYVAADGPAATPYARGYRVTDVLPFSLARLRALLRSRGVGRVTVKKRGSAVDVQALRRDLRLSGPAEATVVLTRLAGAPTVLLCDPFTRL
ncbi:MAG TPA: class I SAM-dependent methyltransferase [Mycobacteriales bacterium]